MQFIVCPKCNATISGNFTSNKEAMDKHNAEMHEKKKVFPILPRNPRKERPLPRAFIPKAFLNANDL